MNIDLLPFLYLWLALDAVIIVLFGWRQKISRAENASVKLTDPVAASHMTVLEAKLRKIDKWIKLLVIIAVIFGAVLGVLAIVQAFNSPSAAVGA